MLRQSLFFISGDTSLCQELIALHYGPAYESVDYDKEGIGMKKKGHMAKLVLMCIILLFAGACSRSPEPYDALGNSNGNISNGGMSVSSSDWIYFMNYADSNALYRMNSKNNEEEKITDDQCYYLNITDYGLIYSNGSDNNHLYRLNLEDFRSEPVIEDVSVNVLFSDGWVYYINRSDTVNKEEYSRIFRIRPDGSSREQVSTEPAAAFNMSGDEIFYLNLEDQSLNRIGTDGTDPGRISETPMVSINVYEEMIYYISAVNGENTIWKMNLDGTDNIQLSKDKSAALNVSEGWIYYTFILDDDSELEIRRMDLHGEGMITFNNDNAISINIHEDWLVYLDMNFSTFLFTQTLVRTDGTGRRDYAQEKIPSTGSILTYDMNEKVSTDELTFEFVSAYATNLLESTDPQEESPVFDEVTDGAYVFIHAIITNDTDSTIDLYQEMGILEDLEREYQATYWPLYADITNEADQEVTTLVLPRERYSESLVVKPGETRNIHIYMEVFEADFPVYIGLFSNESLYPHSAVAIYPSQEKYIVSWSSSLEIMAERFPSAEISQLNGIAYQLTGENEEHFYYTFKVRENFSSESYYYFVRRDNGVVYTGEAVEENPDYIALPVSPVP